MNAPVSAAGHIAAAEAFHDNAVHTGGRGGLKDILFRSGTAFDKPHPARQRVWMDTLAADRTPAPADAVAAHGPHRPPFHGPEGLRQGGMLLFHVLRRMDAVTHDDEYAHTLCTRIGGVLHRSQQIGRAVGRQVRSAAHGPGEDHRLLRAEHCVQQEGCLLHGVRAVGDDEAVRLVREAVDRMRQPEHDLRRHEFAGDIGKFPDLNVRPVCKARRGGGQLLPADRRHEPARFAVLPHGDGASGGDDTDLFHGLPFTKWSLRTYPGPDFPRAAGTCGGNPPYTCSPISTGR